MPLVIIAGRSFNWNFDGLSEL